MCAHGTHDVCCALMGRLSLPRSTMPGPGRVWECSHVGGDRFAANVLVLPTGLLYGRVGAHAVGALADATDRGEVLDQYLRGRVGFSPEVQAAMAFAHRQSPGLRVRDVRSEGLRRVGPDTVAVRLNCAGRIADVRVQSARADPHWLTCQAAQPSRATVYQPLSITWADPGGTPADNGSARIRIRQGRNRAGAEPLPGSAYAARVKAPRSTLLLELVVWTTFYVLPGGVRRAMAGRPLRMEGQTLDPDMQLLLRLERLTAEGGSGLTGAAAPSPGGGRRGWPAAGRRAGVSVSAMTVPGRPGSIAGPVVRA